MKKVPSCISEKHDEALRKLPPLTLVKEYIRIVRDFSSNRYFSTLLLT
jgi:hypothetical protein